MQIKKGFIKCPDCEGRGHFKLSAMDCARCGGSGQIPKEKKNANNES
jgi:DnaJ-class molecular chaperone